MRPEIVTPKARRALVPTVHAVVPAAGEGTRLRPLTADRPKPLVEVAERPLLAHVLDRLIPVDPDAFVVVIGYRGDQIVERFGDQYRNVPLEYVHQENRRGLAHALLQAASIVDGDFLVCHGDNALESDLGYLADRHEGTATLLVEPVPKRRAHRTGIVVTDDRDQVRRVVEKPDTPPAEAVVENRSERAGADDSSKPFRVLASAGAFAFSQALFDACRAIEPGETGEYELSDAITHLSEQNRRVETVQLRGKRVNVNAPLDLERAEGILGR